MSSFSSFSSFITNAVYLIGIFLIILGFKKISLPSTARNGLVWIGTGIFISGFITYFHPEIQRHYIWMTLAILIGGACGYLVAKRSKMADISAIMTLFNGLASGAATTISIAILITLNEKPEWLKYLLVVTILIGSMSFSGCLTAFAKQLGFIKNPIRLPMHQWINALVFVLSVTFGVAIILNGNQFENSSLVLFFSLALIFGVLLTLAISNKELAVITSLFSALTGFAVGFVGLALSNPILMVAGFLAGSVSVLLSSRIATYANSSILMTLLGESKKPVANINTYALDENITAQNIKEINANDAAMMLAYAKHIIIVPGYGMAASQAQEKVWQLCKLLKNNGVEIKFAIHPMAGIIPGHMNVLLAETDIPYEAIYDIDEINHHFEQTDIVLALGANDTINPSARTEKNSPIYGMPILNAAKAKNIIVIKRGAGQGYAGVENPLFYQDNVGLMYGDAQAVLNTLITHLREI